MKKAPLRTRVADDRRAASGVGRGVVKPSGGRRGAVSPTTTSQGVAAASPRAAAANKNKLSPLKLESLFDGLHQRKKARTSTNSSSATGASKPPEQAHVIPAQREEPAITATPHPLQRRPATGSTTGHLAPSAAQVLDPDKCAAVSCAYRRCWGLRTSPARDCEYNPSPNPVSVSMDALRGILPDRYVASEKTDGVRYNLLMCRDHEGVPTAVMVDRSCRKFEVRLCADDKYFDGTLFDGELAWEYGERLIYWIFDVACVAGSSTRERTYGDRYELVHRLVHDPDQYPMLPPGASDRHATSLAENDKIAAINNPHSLCLRPKQCFNLRNIESLWLGVVRNLGHRNDGLIFTPLDKPLPTGTFWEQYKWKQEHTVDLQLRGRRPEDDDKWTLGLYFVEADWTVSKADATDREGPEVAVYRNACEGITYKSAAGDEKQVDFVLEEGTLVSQLLATMKRTQPEARYFKCIAECLIKFIPTAADRSLILCSVKRWRRDKSEPNNRYTVRQTILNVEENITYPVLRDMVTQNRARAAEEAVRP